MIRFQEGSYALTIILKIAMAGEFPFRALDMIGDKIMVQRTLRRLKEEKYVTINGNADLKTIRLTKKALEVIKNYNNDYYEYYMLITDNHHFRAGTYKSNNTGVRQTLRRHRLAEVQCFLDDLGILMWPSEKPELSLSIKDSRINYQDFLFYTSRELKNFDKNQKYKTEFTRILGALYSPGGIYCLYNTNKGLIKWNNQGEQKAQVLIEDITQMNYDFSDGIHHEISNSIIFGKDEKLILEILYSKGSKKDTHGFELLSFNNTYDNIYYITLNDNGLKQLAIMLEYNWHERLKKVIFPEEILKNNVSYSTVDCDAIDKNNNNFILMFFDGNIARLRRFKEAIYGTKNKSFQVLCFPWQEEAVKEYMENMADITVINYEDFKEDFFILND